MSQFIKVAKVSEVPSDTGKLVEIDGEQISLFNVDGKIYAIHAICPHQGGPLNEGGLNGPNVMCPWHGWEFDVTSGVCTFNESIKQPTYKVKVEGDDVLLEM